MPEYNPEYPYKVYLNGKLWGSYVDLEGEEVEGLGADRRWNTVKVYYKGYLMLDVDAEDGEVVHERRRKTEAEIEAEQKEGK